MSKSGLFVFALLAVPLLALATPGGVDANGCHASDKIGYHCHAQKAGKNGGLPGGETKNQREKRLRRECKNMQNAGACLGYGKR